MILYRDSYSGYEIVLLEFGNTQLGVAYDPKQSRDPVPWHTDCRHCTGGLQMNLSIHIKRAIQMIRTRKRAGQRCSYVIPTNSRPHFVVYWVSPDGVRHANVTCGDGSKVLEVSAEPRSKMIYDGNRREFQAPILYRSLELIFSSRAATPDEIAAATKPLLDRQHKCGIPKGRQSACNTIHWSQVLKQLKETRQE